MVDPITLAALIGSGSTLLSSLLGNQGPPLPDTPSGVNQSWDNQTWGRKRMPVRASSSLRRSTRASRAVPSILNPRSLSRTSSRSS